MPYAVSFVREPIEPPVPGGAIAKLGDVAAGARLRRIHILAWRDLDDVEAGGSEVHAATVARLWAQAGIEVSMRSSFAQGHPAVIERDGYRVVRKAGRYLVFPRAVLSELSGRSGPRDGLVEIWNGVPFFTPLWCPGPRIVFLHHVHAEMWRMALPPNLARAGELLESRLAPPLYQRSRIVTLSESSRRELVHDLGFRPERVTVVPPGIDPRFTPGGERSPRPLVASVGRLVPVKRLDVLIRAIAAVREHVPDLELEIVGEGYERHALEHLIADLDAEGWARLVGRVDDAGLVDLYRRAWVVASTSLREGWGMTLTEAAACGTPAVATRISGHEDAVVDGTTGLLVDDEAALAAAIGRVVADRAVRERLGRAALARAATLTWEATALGTLEALADEARRNRLHRLRGRVGA